MLPEIEQRVAFLKQVQIFNELDENQLSQVADRLKERRVPAGEVIFAEGNAPDNVYIIVKGRVSVSRLKDDKTESVISIFSAGYSFGEDALYFNRSRSATITAILDTELLYLNKADFQWLRSNFPQVDPYIAAFTKTHDIARRLNINWLGERETISLIARREPLRMIGEVLAIILILVFVIFTLFKASELLSEDANIFVGIIGGVVSFIGLAVCAWSYADWRNDYFFVTNVRVVWRERILLRSSSRQETPLRTIQSLNVHTKNILMRAIHAGDVIVRTFNSELRMTDVHHPEQMKNMIAGFLQKSRQRSRRAEHAAIRKTIQRQLGYQAEDLIPEEPEEVPPAASEKTRRFAIFKTRIVDGGTITYRKHWFIFFKRAWRQSLLFIIVFLFSLWLTFLMLTNDPRGTGLVLGSAYFVVFCLFLWWLYEYMDWRNDIYRMTRDRIIDREKSPFGQESFRSASIKNIQSLGHKIPGTIGLILNVGDVQINVGDETFTFDGVHDPALVHQDISRQMGVIFAEDERARVFQEHGRMAAWLEIYHEVTKDNHISEDDPDSN